MPTTAKKGEPSAYARHTAALRRERAEKERRRKQNVCGATKRGGGKCQKAAGWGTEHVGIGKCRIHGGATPNHVKNAAGVLARQFLGTPKEMNPLDAILWCIKIRAGEVQWLGERMAELDQTAWEESTVVGKQFHLYARERQAAMRDLTNFSKIAISLGIAERAVKLAETYGELIARYTQALLNDLWPYLDEEGRAQAPSIVRRHLIALDGGLQPEPPETLAIEAAKAA